jgi:hypothetical protein
LVGNERTDGGKRRKKKKERESERKGRGRWINEKKDFGEL